MRILIVSEGDHELGGSLQTLVRRLIPGGPHQIDQRNVRDSQLHVHAGAGAGMFKKAVRCVIFAEEAGYDGLVFLIDADGLARERRPQVDRAQAEARYAIRRAMGVAVETFDAWFLADEQALSQVVGRVVRRQPDPEPMDEPKRICREFANEAKTSLADLYASLAGIVQLEQIEERCPTGFAPFARLLRQMGQ